MGPQPGIGVGSHHADGTGPGACCDLSVSRAISRREVVGWIVARADVLLQLPYDTLGIRPGHCTHHADRGRRMTSPPVVLWQADLRVTKPPS
jgi:hypothetical protein